MVTGMRSAEPMTRRGFALPWDWMVFWRVLNLQTCALKKQLHCLGFQGMKYEPSPFSKDEIAVAILLLFA